LMVSSSWVSVMVSPVVAGGAAGTKGRYRA
jgi:hypothetical protein